MASIPVTGERFDIGRVISRTSSAIRQNALLFLQLAFLLYFVPALIYSAMSSGVAIDKARPFASIFSPSRLGFSVFAFLCYFVLQAAITRATIVNLGGGKASFVSALRAGVTNALPILGLTILTGIGFAIGFVLLIVPAIMLSVIWCVAVPALVEEGVGVFGSLGRSRALTNGSRWRIFGMLVLILIVIYAPLTIAGLMMRGVNPQVLPTFGPGMIVTNLVSTIATMVTATLVAAMYVELRFVKEGAAPESLAAIFD